MRKVFHGMALMLLVLVSACNQSQHTETNDKTYVAVKRVIDGDTFVTEDGTRDGEKIRFIGIDAPESRKTPHEDVQFYGKEAKEFLKKYLKDKKVRLEYDVEHHDQYGRTLAYVYMEDGTFLNAYLVQQGYANVMTIPPNVTYADTFVVLQREAREAKRGMWSDPVL